MVLKAVEDDVMCYLLIDEGRYLVAFAYQNNSERANSLIIFKAFGC